MVLEGFAEREDRMVTKRALGLNIPLGKPDLTVPYQGRPR